MDNRTENIYSALTALCASLGLSGESGTEELFIILSSVFDNDNFEEMELIRQKSNADGLMYNMLWPMTEKIKDVADGKPRTHIPPWNR